MGVDALRKNLGDDTSRDEAQAYLDQYFESYKGIADFMEEKKQEVREQGYTTTYFGRRRYFPEIYSSRSWIQARAERMAINAPVQGTQADVIKKAMVSIDSYLEEEDLKDAVPLLLQVHDELVLEVQKEDFNETASLIKNKMEKTVSLDVPLIADLQKAPNWRDKKDYEVDNNA
jgi:DNA polymerase-1